MLIFLNIKSRVVVPSKRNGKLQPLEAVQVNTFVRTCSHCRISIWQELVLIRFECCPCLISTFLQDNDHESAHKECRVRLFRIVKGSVMINLIALILRVIHQLFQLLTEQMHFAKVKRSEICKERLINEIIVDAEVKGMLP